MTRIELFKSIIKEINNASDYEEMLKNHPKFRKLKVMRYPKDNDIYQAFTPENLPKVSKIDLDETFHMLDTFQTFMTELQKTMDGINYHHGYLYGTAEIGGDLRMVIRAGFIITEHLYDVDASNGDYTLELKPRIGLQFTTTPVEEFSKELDTLINKAGQPSTAVEKHLISDYVTCKIPEYRWYHKPGSSDLITKIQFDDPFERWDNGVEEGCTSTEIQLIRDEIIRMRTIVEIMDINEFKI